MKENMDKSYEYLEVAYVDDLPEGQRLFIDIDDLSLVIFNIGATYFAIENVCSHDDGPIGEGELINYEIHCPRHGAAFDVRDGKVQSLPAVTDITAYPTLVQNGRLFIGLPVE